MTLEIEPTVVTIIPARGGSERVPGKNLKVVNGKPLLAWSILVSLSAQSVSRTIVSTDDESIAGVAREYGAEVVDRPSEISGPHSSSESALIHTVDQLLRETGSDPDIIVFLQATSPLRRKNDVDLAVRRLIDERADSLLSVSTTPGFLWKIDNDVPTPLTYDYRKRPRSQELHNRFVIENGSMFVLRTQLLRKTGCRLGGKIIPYFQPPVCAFDIDHAEDIAVVDAVMRTGALETKN